MRLTCLFESSLLHIYSVICVMNPPPFAPFGGTCIQCQNFKVRFFRRTKVRESNKKGTTFCRSTKTSGFRDLRDPVPTSVIPAGKFWMPSGLNTGLIQEKKIYSHPIALYSHKPKQHHISKEQSKIIARVIHHSITMNTPGRAVPTRRSFSTYPKQKPF